MVLSIGHMRGIAILLTGILCYDTFAGPRRADVEAAIDRLREFASMLEENLWGPQ